MLRDIAYAVRSFARVPGLTLAVIVSIGLGISANTVVFSMVNTLLLKDLPVRDPKHLYVLNTGGSVSLPDYQDFVSRSGQIFEGLAAHSLFPVPANVHASRSAQRIWGLVVTGNYFSLLGVRPAMGRTFVPSEDEVKGRNPVLVLGYGLWQNLGSDPAIVGKTVNLSGMPYTVIGVAPPGFTGTDRGIVAEFWAPLAMRAHLLPDIAGNEMSRTCSWLEMTGRLRPGVRREQAVAALNVINAQIFAEYGEKGRHPDPVNLTQAGEMLLFQREAKLLMTALAVVVALLLLIACANVANLLLARAASRQHEVGVRLALGASRGRLVRQFLTESVLLSSAGAAAGFLLAVPGAAVLSRFQPPFPIPIRFDFTPDLRVLLFTTALAALTGVLFGLAPAFTATRGSVSAAIRQAGWGGRGARRGRLSGVLVAVQVTLCVVLLTASGLFLRSLQRAAAIDTGMKPDGVLSLAVDPKGQGYDDPKSQRFLRELQRRVEAIPGVDSMSYVHLPPLSFARSDGTYIDPDNPAAAKAPANLFEVGSRYFRATGITLLRGRDFDDVRDGRTPVAIINEALAKALFKAEDPLGRHIQDTGVSAPAQIIGIVRNAKVQTLRENTRGCIYRPFQRARAQFGVTLMVRHSGEPAALVRSIREQASILDPNLPLFNIETLRNHVNEAMLIPRVCAGLFGIFGAIGLALAAVGLYGVVSYSVRTQTREIGIRMALGARAGVVAAVVARRGLALVSAGLVAGLAVAFALSRFTASLLVGIAATDSLTFIAVPAILLLVSLVAILLPARRASRIEPLAALRYE